MKYSVIVIGEKLESSEVEEIVKDCAEIPDDEGLTTYDGKNTTNFQTTHKMMPQCTHSFQSRVSIFRASAGFL